MRQAGTEALSWVRQYAHHVSAKNLADGPLVDAGAEERVGQKGQSPRVAELASRDDHSVPIAPQRRRIFAGDVQDMNEVLDHRFEAVAAQVSREKDDANHASLLGDGAELIVVDVAPVPVCTEHAGVTDDWRLRCSRARVEEASTVDVGQIDENTGGLATVDELETEWGEALAVLSPLSVCGVSRVIRREMQEAEVTYAASSKGFHVVEVALERVSTLDAKESADHSVATTGFDLGCAPHQPELVRAAFGGLFEEVDLLMHRVGEPAHSLCDGQRHQSEELRSHAGVAQAGQVDVTREGSAP